MGAGTLAGIGQGVAQLGQMAMQGAIAKNKIDQNNKWLEANIFKKAASSALNNQTEGYQTYLQQKAQVDAAMQAVADAPMQPQAREISQVARMLPDEPTQMGSAALLAKRF